MKNSGDLEARIRSSSISIDKKSFGRKLNQSLFDSKQTDSVSFESPLGVSGRQPAKIFFISNFLS